MIIRYSSDAERKRAEYALEVFSKRLQLAKPSGMVVLVDGDSKILQSLLEELYSRLPNGDVRVYRAEEYNPGVEAKRATLTLRTRMSPEEASGALAAIMAGMKGALVSTTGGARTYLLALKGGRLTARVEVSSLNGGSIVIVELEGYGRVFDKAREALARRLSLIGEVSVG